MYVPEYQTERNLLCSLIKEITATSTKVFLMEYYEREIKKMGIFFAKLYVQASTVA